MDPSGCPDRAELEAFVTGSLPGTSFTRVADHVEHCLDCETALQTLDDLDDPLLSPLRRLPATRGSRAEPVPQELMAAVRSPRTRCGEVAWISAEGGGRRLGKFELLE